MYPLFVCFFFFFVFDYCLPVRQTRATFNRVLCTLHCALLPAASCLIIGVWLKAPDYSTPFTFCAVIIKLESKKHAKNDPLFSFPVHLMLLCPLCSPRQSRNTEILGWYCCFPLLFCFFELSPAVSFSIKGLNPRTSIRQKGDETAVIVVVYWWPGMSWLFRPHYKTRFKQVMMWRVVI